MPLSHLLLALSVVFVWGTNFVVIKWGLDEFPSFLFSALRFVLSALPWVFLLKRPAVPWTRMAALGTLLSVGQFGLLYWAMRHDISPGLASLVVQAQVFFTILLSMAISGERLRPLQVLALGLAVAGYVVVAWHSIIDPAAAVTLAGLAMVLSAAFCWGCANTLVRTAGKVNMLALTTWSCLYGCVPVLVLSLLVDGPQEIAHALANATWHGWLAVLWQALGNTTFAFGVWNWLMARHPASTVAPTALLVPVFGMLSSAWLVAEPLPDWKLYAAVLVLGGLALNLYSGRLAARRHA
ncbi:EamA family transporter [Bordetella genomosp. 13]|uniref:EamA family transporter n=1 Tax=Bordetella genomosp. 13 TaxID=463040 RepID=A0A1W6ZFP1_9BORD|nr:EamA family transporter [Bordetella genomosp. 13]ARP95664.1 EamA family transporter [Bordetella genomosp. 13]